MFSFFNEFLSCTIAAMSLSKHYRCFRMSNRTFLIALIVVSALLCPSSTYAYVDPGTGSQFIQLVVGGCLAALYVLKLYWTRIRNFLSAQLHRLRKS